MGFAQTAAFVLAMRATRPVRTGNTALPSVPVDADREASVSGLKLAAVNLASLWIDKPTNAGITAKEDARTASALVPINACANKVSS